MKHERSSTKHPRKSMVAMAMNIHTQHKTQPMNTATIIKYVAAQHTDSHYNMIPRPSQQDMVTIATTHTHSQTPPTTISTPIQRMEEKREKWRREFRQHGACQGFTAELLDTRLYRHYSECPPPLLLSVSTRTCGHTQLYVYQSPCL